MTSVVELHISDYKSVRTVYRAVVIGVIKEYLETPNMNYRSSQSKMKTATVSAYITSAKIADKKSNDVWLNAKIALVILFIAKLWEDLWQDKRSGQMTQEEIDAIAQRHTDNYVRGLDGVFSEANVRRSSIKNVPLTLKGIDGRPPEFPCQTCDNLKGQTHPAEWWVTNNLIPYQGNPNYACGCWGCKHGLFDGNNTQYTL
jgi:hypothetical protein